MKQRSTAFVSDGLKRLLDDAEYRRRQAAVEAAIRQKYAGELAAAKTFWRRIAIQQKIRREINASKPSPYSLWSSRPPLFKRSSRDDSRA